MRETIAGTGSGDIPRFDAVDLLARISQAVPPALEVKLDDIRLDGRSLRLVGTTTGFQQARALVDALLRVQCIVSLRSDKTIKKGDRVMFTLSGRIDCSVELEADAKTSAVGKGAPTNEAAGAKPSGVGASGGVPASASPAAVPVPVPVPAAAAPAAGRGYIPPPVGKELPEEPLEEPEGSDDDEASSKFKEPLVDPASGKGMPNVIPNPYPSLGPYVPPTIKLPKGVGSVMKLPEESLGDITTEEPEE
jgi:hypothetical protein